MIVNQVFLDKAKALEPVLFRKEVKPVRQVVLLEDPSLKLGWKAETSGAIEEFHQRQFAQDDVVVLDFGEHLVGYLNIDAKPCLSHADSPLRLKLTFGELPCDTAIPAETFDGILGRSWLQTESVTLDHLPCRVNLPRRYAFRYLRMEVVGLSPYYRVAFPEITCTAVTSADESKLALLPEGTDPLLVRIDDAGTRTLRDCMQSTIEDGPKRDRRCWVFDAYVGLKTNYYTYRNDDMAKRLLYLTAAFSHDDGSCPTCLYVQPEYEAGSEKLADYESAIILMLKDYVDETHDLDLLKELWPTARRQMHVAMQNVQPDGLFDPESFCLCWSSADKQVTAQSYMVMCLKEYEALAEMVGDAEESAFAHSAREQLVATVRSKLYDPSIGLYISGAKREVSWRSQVWAVVSGVASKEEADGLFERVKKYPDSHSVESATSYAMYIQAMIDCGRKDEALEMLKAYFGAMLDEGADTFFEHFNLGWTFPCQYRHVLMDSYCHAFNSTASYFIRKYFI